MSNVINLNFSRLDRPLIENPGIICIGGFQRGFTIELPKTLVSALFVPEYLTLEQITLLDKSEVARGVLSLLQNSRRYNNDYSLEYIYLKLKNIFSKYDKRSSICDIKNLNFYGFVTNYTPMNTRRHWNSKRKERLKLNENFYLGTQPGDEVDKLIKIYSK